MHKMYRSRHLGRWEEVCEPSTETSKRHGKLSFTVPCAETYVDGHILGEKSTKRLNNRWKSQTEALMQIGYLRNVGL